MHTVSVLNAIVPLLHTMKQLTATSGIVKLTVTNATYQHTLLLRKSSDEHALVQETSMC